MLPSRCPGCTGAVDVGLAGPRLAFCRSCHTWWTAGGRALRRAGTGQRRR